MTQITLDGLEMKSRKQTYRYLKAKFNLPDYFGENLDAFWDLMSVYDREAEISLVNANNLIENLEEYGENIIKLLRELENENKNLSIEINY